MKLWLVRHAAAEELSASITSDFDRPLSSSGRRKFSALVDRLAKAGKSPELVLSSPLLRAMQTARILRKGFDMRSEAVREEPRVGPGFDLSDVVDLIRTERIKGVVAIVGHEPDMSRSLADLVGGGRFDFGKGNIACIEFAEDPAVGTGLLRWFVRPSLAG